MCKKKTDNNTNTFWKKFCSTINCEKTAHRLSFILTAAVMVICVWFTIDNINHRVYGDKEAVTGKVIIDVSISDTLTRGMDDKLNRVLQDILQIKQDSVAVEVRKVHNQ